MHPDKIHIHSASIQTGQDSQERLETRDEGENDQVLGRTTGWNGRYDPENVKVWQLIQLFVSTRAANIYEWCPSEDKMISKAVPSGIPHLVWLDATKVS